MTKTRDTITSLPQAPADERRRRMVEYTVMMSIRVACVLVCILLGALHVSFWWIVAPAIGAVFLPYFAVVTANAARSSFGPAVERPGSIVRHDDER